MMTDLNPFTITGPVLVIAPHPDDETLGCGGLIAALVSRKVAVHTIFVTDGSSSHRHSLLWPPARLAKQRQAEAAAALEALGAGEQPRTFLGLKDASMPERGNACYEAALSTVLNILTNLRPSLVLEPWRRDPHCDHRDAWSLVQDALERANQDPERLEYTIWLDELGAPEDFPAPGEVETVRFDNPGMVQIKRRAIAAHQSQLGGLIHDDPTGFFLTPATLDRLIQSTEIYWRA